VNAADAYRDLVVGALVVVMLALLLIEPLVERRKARRKAARGQQKLAAPVSHAQARTALDEAYAQATEQALAQAETGQGWAMPTRQQVADDLAAVSVEHDQVDLSTQECLAFAALAAGFDRAFRPPITTEPTDPDDAHQW